MRNAFADELGKIAEENDKVVMLSADIGNKLFDKFKEKFPDRFYNTGVAEQNTIGVASGLSMCGYKPIAYTITPFITNRCLEHIRDDLCYQEQPAIVVGVGAGLSYGELGPTHHSCEDIAILRSLPTMTVLCPGDPMEVRALLREAVKRNTPVYMRMGKKGEKNIHPEVPKLEIGKAYVMSKAKDIDGRLNDVCLLSVGNMLQLSDEIHKELEAKGISTTFVSFHTIKPLDSEFLLDAFQRYKVVVSLEEHSLIGGLGSAISEWLVDNNVENKLIRVGTDDRFMHEAGHQEYARQKLGINKEVIIKRIIERLDASQSKN
ncbi:MAG TPA: transketolase C-terminal domain-containing protein [Alphaproteobacteria bacterium]|nr:transketolase C-terminal domain-containing protein [Alphaproteobacteria bacterium]